MWIPMSVLILFLVMYLVSETLKNMNWDAVCAGYEKQARSWPSFKMLAATAAIGVVLRVVIVCCS